jgi:ABC-type lipoprotein release transport system permease subunit
MIDAIRELLARLASFFHKRAQDEDFDQELRELLSGLRWRLAAPLCWHVFPAQTFLCVATVAGYVPARRASRLNPLDTLRCD